MDDNTKEFISRFKNRVHWFRQGGLNYGTESADYPIGVCDQNPRLRNLGVKLAEGIWHSITTFDVLIAWVTKTK
ncbi:TPA: hypothetical protein EYN09_15935 [Candidatus Poribacteria bacterium]|nr:hypothetical protein [Candidatus Poribacteria bacterium]HIO08401.1 hypothetical protein [Candidatus Poribacteria bacterium]